MDWPNWSGETVVVVGTGPSVKDVDLNPALPLAKVFVIKSEYKFCPSADALYGIDKSWWIANRGAADFKGLKFSPSPTVCRVYRDVRMVWLRPRAEVLTKQVGVVGCGLKTGGGHSGFQVANLSVQFGAKRLLLVGFDMTSDGGGRRLKHEPGVAKIDAGRIEGWRAAMDAAAPQFERLGVEVINCSPVSALKAYRRMSLDEALNGSQNKD